MTVTEADYRGKGLLSAIRRSAQYWQISISISPTPGATPLLKGSPLLPPFGRKSA